jgi:hypothetical protein
LTACKQTVLKDVVITTPGVCLNFGHFTQWNGAQTRPLTVMVTIENLDEELKAAEPLRRQVIQPELEPGTSKTPI